MKEKYKCEFCGGEHDYKNENCNQCEYINRTGCSIPCIDCRNQSEILNQT